MTRITAIAPILLGLSLAACSREEAPPPAPPPEPAAEVPAAPDPEPQAEAVAAADEEPSAEEVPVPEDFAEEAEEQINTDNYVAEITSLEKELSELEKVLGTE